MDPLLGSKVMAHTQAILSIMTRNACLIVFGAYCLDPDSTARNFDSQPYLR